MTKVVPFAPIIGLGEVRVAEVRERMIGGESISSLQRLIHETWGELGTMQPLALHKMLSRYRASTVKPAQKQEIAQILERPLPALRKSLNAINGLEEALEMHLRRIQKWMKQEDGMMLPMKQVSEDLRLLKDMWKDLGALQLEAGIIKRAPKTTLSEFFGADGSHSAVRVTEAWEQAMAELDMEDLGEVTDVEPIEE